MSRLAWTLLVAALAGCGTTDSDRFDLRTPGSAQPVVREPAEPDKPSAQEVGVIRRWSDSLRAGKVGVASAIFAVPAYVYDGTNPQLRTLPNRQAVRQFNAGLTCGAKLVRTQRGQGSYVVGTFRLTERPGPGRCGSGVGNLASTAFVIEERHIVRWLRVPNPSRSESNGG
ncbi:MAG TPA: hypothetical protein VHJ39_11165 [Solirubrobacteraceae bacterium]|jgi:hypothetical protein|nr:hypothetical protein [Solirubrobacteraceae bacterium]